MIDQGNQDSKRIFDQNALKLSFYVSKNSKQLNAAYLKILLQEKLLSTKSTSHQAYLQEIRHTLQSQMRQDQTSKFQLLLNNLQKNAANFISKDLKPSTKRYSHQVTVLTKIRNWVSKQFNEVSKAPIYNRCSSQLIALTASIQQCLGLTQTIYKDLGCFVSGLWHSYNKLMSGLFKLMFEQKQLKLKRYENQIQDLRLEMTHQVDKLNQRIYQLKRYQSKIVQDLKKCQEEKTYLAKTLNKQEIASKALRDELAFSRQIIQKLSSSMKSVKLKPALKHSNSFGSFQLSAKSVQKQQNIEIDAVQQSQFIQIATQTQLAKEKPKVFFSPQQIYQEYSNEENSFNRNVSVQDQSIFEQKATNSQLRKQFQADIKAKLQLITVVPTDTRNFRENNNIVPLHEELKICFIGAASKLFNAQILLKKLKARGIKGDWLPKFIDKLHKQIIFQLNKHLRILGLKEYSFQQSINISESIRINDSQASIQMSQQKSFSQDSDFEISKNALSARPSTKKLISMEPIIHRKQSILQTIEQHLTPQEPDQVPSQFELIKIKPKAKPIKRSHNRYNSLSNRSRPVLKKQQSFTRTQNLVSTQAVPQTLNVQNLSKDLYRIAEEISKQTNFGLKFQIESHSYKNLQKHFVNLQTRNIFRSIPVTQMIQYSTLRTVLNQAIKKQDHFVQSLLNQLTITRDAKKTRHSKVGLNIFQNVNNKSEIKFSKNAHKTTLKIIQSVWQNVFSYCSKRDKSKSIPKPFCQLAYSCLTNIFGLQYVAKSKFFQFLSNLKLLRQTDQKFKCFFALLQENDYQLPVIFIHLQENHEEGSVNFITDKSIKLYDRAGQISKILSNHFPKQVINALQLQESIKNGETSNIIFLKILHKIKSIIEFKQQNLSKFISIMFPERDKPLSLIDLFYKLQIFVPSVSQRLKLIIKIIKYSNLNDKCHKAISYRMFVLYCFSNKDLDWKNLIQNAYRNHQQILKSLDMNWQLLKQRLFRGFQMNYQHILLQSVIQNQESQLKDYLLLDFGSKYVQQWVQFFFPAELNAINIKYCQLLIK